MTSSTNGECVPMGNGIERDFRGHRSPRKEQPTEEHFQNDLSTCSNRIMSREIKDRDLPGEATIPKAATVTSEDLCPTALSLRLDLVRGPDRLPDEKLQEALRGKLRVLEADSREVTALFSELSARLLSISSEESTILITFKTFEEIWKFNTYYTMGFLAHFMENLLLDQEFWLSSLEEDNAGIEVSIQEEKLNLMYRGILMQEGSFFGCCSANQMFDSSTSGSDLYLEQGDIAVFEPPFMGSGWTVQSLVDGARGTKLKPAVEPAGPFHQWFLKSCAENVVVGSGKLACDFPCQFAAGSCVTTQGYDATGPDELSFECGDLIHIAGLLVSCFQWFLGKHEQTGGVGLVKTSLVKPARALNETSDIFLNNEDRLLFDLKEDRTKAETIFLLNKTTQSDVTTVYKLDKIDCQNGIQNSHSDDDGGAFSSYSKREQLKHKIDGILKEMNQPRDPPASSKDAETSSGEGDGEAGGRAARVPCFAVRGAEEDPSPEDFQPLLAFLNRSDFQEEFHSLYHFSMGFLRSLFHGYTDEEEVVSYLGVARETARKKRLYWAQSRVCFLLGKMCARRSKFSQARVYFEEALSIVRDDFADLLLLIAIYTNLAYIYITQKNTEKYFALSERLAALLMGVPNYICSTEKEPEVLSYILVRAIMARNKAAEARACFLLAKLYSQLNESQSAVPFTERLQALSEELPETSSAIPIHCYLTLGKLYGESHLPHLAVSSVRRALLYPSATLTDCLSGIGFVLENTPRLYGVGKQGVTVPTQVAPYLNRALLFPSSAGDRTLCQAVSLCLSYLYQRHSMLDEGIQCMHALVDKGPGTSLMDTNSALISLAWLHICNQQHHLALDILDCVLSSMPENCTTVQEGVIYNMRAIALKGMGDVKQASDSYQEALNICEEFDSKHNMAIALANFGLLCLHANARRLSEVNLIQSVELFSELDDEDHEVNFITVLLELGQFYISQKLLEKGKIYYEWALLLAIKANNLDCELQATRHLCQLYLTVSPDEAQCIIYNEHHLSLVRKTGDKSREGDILETISQLYLSLGTERAYRSALEHTKCSLGIFIDLRKKQKEAHAWLQAGKIYHILKQNELVDLYVQVAQDSGLSTGDTPFILRLLELAGDLFFNGSQDRDKALSFYRDRALPIAVKTGNVRSQLRLSNKLVELLMQMKQYDEALEFAKAALEMSITLGEQLNERVAFHRLATLYHLLCQFELAEHCYLKTLALCPSPLQFDEETLYYVRVYQTLGDIVFYDLKDPHDAAGYYQLALAAAMDLGNKRSQLKLCTRLATIYHNFLVDRDLSLYFYQKARGFAADLNVRRINLAPDQYFCSTSQYKSC